MKAGSGRVQGKNALVTGSASRNGIGFATARALAREGANVTLTDPDEAKVSARAVALQGEGLHALGIRQDVTREEDWASAVDAAETAFGPIDVLVNNACITSLRTLDALTRAHWAVQIDVNLKSVFRGCRTTLERMRRSGRRGSIINVSSVAGLVGMRRCTAYSASKGGIRLFTKSLALETAAEGIR